MKDWKTTLSGLASAIFFAATGTHDWKHVVTAIGIAVLGYFAKDC